MRDLVLVAIILSAIGLGYEVGTVVTQNKIQDYVCSTSVEVSEYLSCVDKQWDDIKQYIEFKPSVVAMPNEEI